MMAGHVLVKGRTAASPPSKLTEVGLREGRVRWGGPRQNAAAGPRAVRMPSACVGRSACGGFARMHTAACCATNLQRQPDRFSSPLPPCVFLTCMLLTAWPPTDWPQGPAPGQSCWPGQHTATYQALLGWPGQPRLRRDTALHHRRHASLGDTAGGEWPHK